ncbi:MAG: Na+/H+ antiporter subunit E [Microthrixaceae bacterium]
MRPHQRPTRNLAVHCLLVVWLAVVWVMLWGEPSAVDVVGGLVLGGALVALFPLRLGSAEPVGSGARVRPLALLRFALWFAGALVMASLQVAAQVLRPRPVLSQGIVAVPMRAASPLVVSVVANTITLTPGTLTIEVSGPDTPDPSNPPVLYVHCLVTGDPEAVRADGRHLEDRVVRALGTAADRSAIAQETTP